MNKYPTTITRILERFRTRRPVRLPRVFSKVTAMAVAPQAMAIY